MGPTVVRARLEPPDPTAQAPRPHGSSPPTPRLEPPDGGGQPAVKALLGSTAHTTWLQPPSAACERNRPSSASIATS